MSECAALVRFTFWGFRACLSHHVPGACMRVLHDCDCVRRLSVRSWCVHNLHFQAHTVAASKVRVHDWRHDEHPRSFLANGLLVPISILIRHPDLRVPPRHNPNAKSKTQSDSEARTSTRPARTLPRGTRLRRRSGTAHPMSSCTPFRSSTAICFPELSAPEPTLSPQDHREAAYSARTSRRA